MEYGRHLKVQWTVQTSETRFIVTPRLWLQDCWIFQCGKEEQEEEEDKRKRTIVLPLNDLFQKSTSQPQKTVFGNHDFAIDYEEDVKKAKENLTEVWKGNNCVTDPNCAASEWFVSAGHKLATGDYFL